MRMMVMRMSQPHPSLFHAFLLPSAADVRSRDKAGDDFKLCHHPSAPLTRGHPAHARRWAPASYLYPQSVDMWSPPLPSPPPPPSPLHPHLVHDLSEPAPSSWSQSWHEITSFLLLFFSLCGPRTAPPSPPWTLRCKPGARGVLASLLQRKDVSRSPVLLLHLLSLAPWTVFALLPLSSPLCPRFPPPLPRLLQPRRANEGAEAGERGGRAHKAIGWEDLRPPPSVVREGACRDV
ncbi:unnamed protein product [Pleuronectes platessa]|uniref:Uncharacterized protein n=1 Tax=Pleuronectes platessa TaxID=8262 RepID=A0A9N7UFZ7_PLEPL|nr:unnamed protein product [Pleuronectes platessa]